MAMTDIAAGSPEWWLKRLSEQLYARQADMALMDDYYRGAGPLPFVTKAHEPKMRDEFRQLLNDSRSNFMRLVVDTTEERLKVDGFRLSAQDDPLSDRRSWEIWQANSMDANVQAAFTEALVKGVSYLSVWMQPNADYPTIAVEDPTQTIVGYTPGSNYMKRDAALKLWDDDVLGVRRADVYLKDAIYKFQGKPARARPTMWRRPSSGESVFGDNPTYTWEPLGESSWVPTNKSPNKTGVIPIIPLRNRPRLLCEGESELSDVFRIQNQINGFLFLLALAGYFGAHRQRWALGVKLLVDPATGKSEEPWDAAVDKLWWNENPEGKFGEFSATELGPYIQAIEQKVLHIAVTTRTPRHYLIQQGQSPSGDAIESAESGLVAKIERKQRTFGEGLEEAIRLAREFAGEDDAPVDSEIVWGDAATESLATVTDAVIKQFAAGLIPWEAALEKLDYSQTQIARFAEMRASDVLFGDVTEPPNPKVSWQGNIVP